MLELLRSVAEDAQKCISSPHFPQNYTSADYCRIAVNHTVALPIEVEGFETESNYDTLTVNCEAFSGEDATTKNDLSAA